MRLTKSHFPISIFRNLKNRVLNGGSHEAHATVHRVDGTNDQRVPPRPLHSNDVRGAAQGQLGKGTGETHRAMLLGALHEGPFSSLATSRPHMPALAGSATP